MGQYEHQGLSQGRRVLREDEEGPVYERSGRCKGRQPRGEAVGCLQEEVSRRQEIAPRNLIRASIGAHQSPLPPCGYSFWPPSAPFLHEVQIPKPLELPIMAAHL